MLAAGVYDECLERRVGSLTPSPCTSQHLMLRSNNEGSFGTALKDLSIPGEVDRGKLMDGW